MGVPMLVGENEYGRWKPNVLKYPRNKVAHNLPYPLRGAFKKKRGIFLFSVRYGNFKWSIFFTWLFLVLRSIQSTIYAEVFLKCISQSVSEQSSVNINVTRNNAINLKKCTRDLIINIWLITYQK
jgi:hypothetical protein